MTTPVWAPSYLPRLPFGEPIGFTAKGDAVRWSPALYRWFAESLVPRIGGATGPGLDVIVTVLTEAVADIDALQAADVALDARLDAVEPELVAQDARIDALEAEIEELNMKPAVRTDADADPPTLIYRGEAAAGSIESAAVWRIKKIVFTGVDSSTTWADGNTNFDNVWNDRATLTYI